ncbi:MAG: aminopeptidase [Betaproteobacteria bacterium]
MAFAGQLCDTLKEVMGIRKGETALIIHDDYAQQVGDITREALQQEGVKVESYLLPVSGRPLQEVPADLARLIETLRPDLFFNQFEGFGEETPFRIALLNLEEGTGGRIGHSPDITMGMIEGPMTADFGAMKKAARHLKKRFRGVKTVRLTAPAGTDVIFDIAGRAFLDDITIGPGHPGNLPAGEVWCAPLERSMNGTIVCDGSIGDLGQVREPLIIGVDKGRVVTMKSTDTVLVERVRQLMGVDDEASLAGEFGIGLNPKARLTGLLLEDEKAYGTVHIAFGGNTDMPGGRNGSRTHRDFLIRSPSIILPETGEYVMRDGVLIEPALLAKPLKQKD